MLPKINGLQHSSPFLIMRWGEMVSAGCRINFIPRAAYVILSEEGTVVMNDCYNGFDEEARRNIQNFMQQQAEQAQQKQQEMQAQAQTGQTQSGETQKKKPELANWQKVMDNGEYLRSAEMAEEAK